jgi:serine protease Do
VNAAFWAGHPLQPAQGIGFAIPINMAKSLLPRLRAKGDAARSFLGVDAQPLDSALAVAMKLESTRGALIASVGKKSPAESGGLEPGDVVVTWNGTPIATSEDLKIDAQLTVPGTRVRVGLWRDGRAVEREVTVRVAEGRTPMPTHPSSCSRKREITSGGPEDFDVSELPTAQAASLPGGRGIAIAQLSGHGAAAQAGLKIGDVILRIGKQGVRSSNDLSTALRIFKAGTTVPMLVRRGGFDFWTAFTRR